VIVYKRTAKFQAKVAALSGAPLQNWDHFQQRRGSKKPDTVEHYATQPTQSFCVSVSGADYERCIELKSWGFKWCAPTKSWIRLFSDKGKAISLARDLRDRGYPVKLHNVKPQEAPKPIVQKQRIEIYGPVTRTEATGKARSYRGQGGQAAISAGDAHKWRENRR